MYDFDRTFDRHNTEVSKWDRLEKDFGRKDLIPFGIADMDFETLPEITRALTERAKHPTYGYTFPSEGYYESFIEWNRTRNHFDIKKEELITIPGVVCACSFIIYALTEKGDKVMVNTPVYDPFFKVIEQQERTLVTSSLKLEHGRYEIDFEDMEEKFKEGVKLFILCSPHNPVGRVWTMEELTRLNDLCSRYHVLVFSDEIHSDLIFPGHKHIPYQTVNQDAAGRSVTAMAPSKTFNIAGLKSSVLIIKNPELYSRVNKVVTAFHVGVDLFGLKAFEVAYRHGAAYVDELNQYLYENAQFVAEYVAENLPAAKTYVQDGTYLMWLDFTALGLSQKELMEKVVGAGVAPNDGSHYGIEGNGFLRINIGTQRAMLKEGLERLKTIFG